MSYTHSDGSWLSDACQSGYDVLGNANILQLPFRHIAVREAQLLRSLLTDGEQYCLAPFSGKASHLSRALKSHITSHLHCRSFNAVETSACLPERLQLGLLVLSFCLYLLPDNSHCVLIMLITIPALALSEYVF